MSALHDCPVAGCDNRISRELLMCRGHWRLVPAPLKNEVWRTWRNGAGVLDPVYRAASARAIETVERLLDRRAA